MDIPKAYDKNRESEIYAGWIENNLFKAEVSDKTPFCIMIPPPNITDKLHMGHAFNNTIQDVLIRFKRMQGFSALYLPGTDHAAIATEVIVIKNLEKQGITKESLGREGFLEKLWEWNDLYGSQIINQLKKIGTSCDFNRTRFTMDEGLSKAVLEAFVRLYDEGKIYKGEKLVNWCVKCKTSISDAEVEHEDKESFLYYFKYEVEGEGFISFATTRPETMLGDTAVAVNPNDARYAHMVGKFAAVPFVNRKIPIITDSHVDMDYGTGAVKVTPAHDFHDYEIAARAGILGVNIFDDEGRVNSVCQVYEGLGALEARAKIIEQMKDLGLLIKEEPITHAVGTHDRCGTVIEPLLKLQWFLKMDELSGPAKEALTSGRLKFNKDRFAKIYMHWLNNIRDWNISRQLWWGHRIPAYYCTDGHITVAVEQPDKCKTCGDINLYQDEYVLDTWFSSALWPFSTLGWPEKTADLDYFYPTNILVTAQDIIFLWVVRMVFMGEKFMGKTPFSHVLINGTIRDEQGRKMSKSLGNGVDPLEVVEEFGADVLRLMLVGSGAIDNDTRFFPERLEPTRNFLNKLWNASRFVMMQVNSEKQETRDEGRETKDGLFVTDENVAKLVFKLEDRWILAKLDQVISDVTKNLEEFELGLAVGRIIEFVWDDFCDWYVEMVKPRLYSKTADSEKTASAAKYTLKAVLIKVYKLLHPFTPFITEDLFQALINKNESIMISDWPISENIKDDFSKDMEIIREAIRKIRNIRADKEVPPSAKIEIIIVPKTNVFDEFLDIFAALCQASSVEIKKDFNPDSEAVSIVTGAGVIYLPMSSLVDTEKEFKRLTKEKVKLIAEIGRINDKLTNEGFMSKAPAKLIESEKAKLADFTVRLSNVESELVRIHKNA